jgi:hypothetical protein
MLYGKKKKISGSNKVQLGARKVGQAQENEGEDEIKEIKLDAESEEDEFLDMGHGKR